MWIPCETPPPPQNHQFLTSQVNTVHFTEHEPSNFLHCITYLNPQSCPKRKMPVSGQRHLPLASLAKLLEESLHKQNYAHANYDITTSVYTVEYGTAANSGMKQVSAYAGGGRILGMVYRSLGEVEQYAYTLCKIYIY